MLRKVAYIRHRTTCCHYAKLAMLMSTKSQPVAYRRMVETIDLRGLGQTVRFLRQGKGWTLSDLSEKSGVGKAYISDLENNVAGKPNIQYVFSIARALGVTLDRLIHGTSLEAPESDTVGDTSTLPPGLAQLKSEKGLTDKETQMLAQVNFRGNRPKDVEGWRFLYQTIRLLGER